MFSSGSAFSGCYGTIYETLINYIANDCIIGFENKTTVRVSDISDTQVMITWDSLGRVVDRNGNPRGTVQGYYILVCVNCVCLCCISMCLCMCMQYSA